MTLDAVLFCHLQLLKHSTRTERKGPAANTADINFLKRRGISRGTGLLLVLPRRNNLFCFTAFFFLIVLH
jgi:hypothetical protein